MRRPTWLETLLLVLLAAALTALLVRGDGGAASRSAYAGGGGTSGVVAFTGQNIAGTGRAELLYVVDTAKQRLCVYNWDGAHLGLVSARAFDYDLEVLDSSGDKNIENGLGASRGYIKAQVEAARRQKEMQPPPK